MINTLISPEPGHRYRFGYRLEMSNDLVAVFENRDINGINWVGKVSVFEVDGSLKYTLQPDELHNKAEFGECIGIGNDILLIKETGFELNPTASGMVHQYNHEGKFIDTIFSPEPIANGQFGNEMEIVEDLIFISQYGDQKLGLSGPGYVYIYDYEWNHLMTLGAPENEEQAKFGHSISVSEDVIVDRIEDSRSISAALLRYCHLEQSGWKRGSRFSVGGYDKGWKFYEAFVNDLAKENMVSMFFLRCGKEDIAGI